MQFLTDFWGEFLQHLFGSYSAAFWAAAWLEVLVGNSISMLISVKKRDKNSPRTPYKFSLSFFLRDNLQRTVLNILVAYVYLRFAFELLGVELTMWISVLIGLFLDRLVNKLRDKNLIDKR